MPSSYLYIRNLEARESSFFQAYSLCSLSRKEEELELRWSPVSNRLNLLAVIFVLRLNESLPLVAF